MRLETSLTVVIVVCILLHDSNGLINLGSPQNSDICTRKQKNYESSGFKIRGEITHGSTTQTTCSSDSCREDNIDNHTLHTELREKYNKYLIEGDILCEYPSRNSIEKVVEANIVPWRPKIKFKIEDTFDERQKQKIREALKTFGIQISGNGEQPPCSFSLTESGMITDDQHILFKKGSGYFTDVGKRAEGTIPHNITLSDKIIPGSVMHEVMHALGFWHEHVRPDRDNYIKVLSENIKDKEEPNFIPLLKTQVKRGYEEIRYDPCSILHYRKDAFSKTGNPTIELIGRQKQYNDCMGQRIELMWSDVKRIRTLFGCSTKEENT